MTVKNFLAYVKSGFYNGTIFHRVIPGFMIQGGGLTAELREKDANAAIKNESGNGLKNARGSIAMARTERPRQRHLPVLHQPRRQCSRPQTTR